MKAALRVILQLNQQSDRLQRALSQNKTGKYLMPFTDNSSEELHQLTSWKHYIAAAGAILPSSSKIEVNNNFFNFNKFIERCCLG